jgi:hypothetical protein
MEKMTVVRKVPSAFSKHLRGLTTKQITDLFVYCWDLWVKKMCLDTWGEPAKWEKSNEEIWQFIKVRGLCVPYETVDVLFNWSFQYFLTETVIEAIDYVGVYSLSHDLIVVETDLTTGGSIKENDRRESNPYSPTHT